MENMGRTHGYNVLLCTTGNDKDRELLYLCLLYTSDVYKRQTYILDENHEKVKI